MVKQVIPDVFWLTGLAAVAFGIGLVFMPAGIIAAGLGLCFTGWVLGENQEKAEVASPIDPATGEIRRAA